MKIPTWTDCLNVKEEDRNPLEKFIYENEPAGVNEPSVFRRTLSDALRWYASTIQEQGDAVDVDYPVVVICPFCKQKTFNNPCGHCGKPRN